MFDGVDYQRIMSLKYPAIRIDVRNESNQSADDNSQHNTIDSKNDSTNNSDHKI